MKLQIFILSFILCLGNLAKAQSNLVPNGGFEQNSGCPQNGSYNNVIDWIDPTGATSDLLDTCAHNTGINLPLILLQNYIYRYPNSGGAMSGIFLMNKGSSCPSVASSNYREYIEVKLNDSLINNHLYYVEFYTVPVLLILIKLGVKLVDSLWELDMRNI